MNPYIESATSTNDAVNGIMDTNMVDIKGYESRYAVTRDGRVWSYLCQRFLKPNGVLGYEQVQLRKNARSKPMTVHRLVAMAYIPNVDNLAQVNHIDGDKKNNRVENLEWTDHSSNIKHAYATGLINRSSRKELLILARQQRAVKTHCKNGHEFTTDNTYTPPGHPLKRNCKKCLKKYHRIRYQNSKLEQSNMAV